MGAGTSSSAKSAAATASCLFLLSITSSSVVHGWKLNRQTKLQPAEDRGLDHNSVSNTLRNDNDNDSLLHSSTSVNHVEAHHGNSNNNGDAPLLSFASTDPPQQAGTTNNNNNNNNNHPLSYHPPYTPEPWEEDWLELLTACWHRVASTAALGRHHIHRLGQQIVTIWCFEPPTGAVALILGTYWLHHHFVRSNVQTEESAAHDRSSSSKTPTRARTGRALQLDPDDAQYKWTGGIQMVQCRLCAAALRQPATNQRTTSDDTTTTRTTSDSAAPQQQDNSLDDNEDDGVLKSSPRLVATALETLTHSRTSRIQLARLVQQLIPALAATSLAATTLSAASSSSTSSSSFHFKTPRHLQQQRRLPTPASATSSSQQQQQQQQILAIATVTLHIQALDALLRLARDHLLQTTYRLVRTKEHWEQRLVLLQDDHEPLLFGGFMSLVWQWPMNLLLSDNYPAVVRLRLAQASAAYQLAVQRLGRLEQWLQQRPDDMDQAWLLQAAATATASKQQRTPRAQQAAATAATISTTTSTSNTMLVIQPSIWEWLTTTVTTMQLSKPPLPTQLFSKLPRWKRPTLSKYSLGWVGGMWWIRKFDDLAELDAEAATRALLAYQQQQQSPANASWLQEATDWTRQARRLIVETVQESLQTSVDHDLQPIFTAAINDGNNNNSNDLAAASREWVDDDKQQGATQQQQQQEQPINELLLQRHLREQQWQQIVHHVNKMSTWRRVGEGKRVRLRDAAIVSWPRQLDYMGIPSYAASVWAAHVFSKWIQPRWPRLRMQGLEVARTVLDIWLARVWVPLIGLVDEIMNKSKGMMSALSLQDEQMSLDHMLRDLGFGDGTSSTRPTALQQATLQYERDLSSGVFVNFARGRLVRLLLLQVQQLKVGLLSAMDTIDVLMKGNKIHFQIMAVIPAVWITYYGTRVFLRALYNIRAKDLRPVTVVHAEMSKFLDQMERLLLFADHSPTRETGGDTGGGGRSYRGRVESSNLQLQLSAAQLGELVLYMHRYLVLLDFGSPPFPTPRCDQIHASLQELLGSNWASSNARVAWLHTIQQKHQDLLKQL